MTAYVIIPSQTWRRPLLLAIVVGGMALSACGATPRYPVAGVQQVQPQYPAAPTPAPAPAPVNLDSPTGKPTTPVQIQDLPPIGASARVTMAAPPPPGQIARTTPPPADISAPVSSPPVPAAATPTPVVAQDVIVAAGENLFDVAERTRTPVRALIELNGLQPPYALQAGARLKAPPALEYQIAPGDTLFGVARRFSIDPRSLATLNDMTLETQLRQGRRLSLPALARDQGAAAGATGPMPEGMGLAEASRPAATPRAAPVTPPIASSQTARREPLPAPIVTPSAPTASDTAPTDQEVAAVGRGKFLWPLRGDILSAYGPKGPGQRNDGLNISAKAGDTVKAAAAGEVVFAGELPGFGNLVLLKHDGGWVTAYAHLSKIGVRMRDTVSQGQAVGQVGQSGGTVDRPQLHFEIRYAANPRDKAKPVDPAMLLPG